MTLRQVPGRLRVSAAKRTPAPLRQLRI
jgi:hypothetical protein